MTPIRQRVDRLIALATGSATPTEEARSAAMIACKLIAEHRLLGAGASPASAPSPASRPQSQWAASVDQAMRDAVDALRRQVQEEKAAREAMDREAKQRRAAEAQHGPSVEFHWMPRGFDPRSAPPVGDPLWDPIPRWYAKTSPDPKADTPTESRSLRDQFEETFRCSPEAVAKKRYAEGWERTFGKESGR